MKTATKKAAKIGRPLQVDRVEWNPRAVMVLVAASGEKLKDILVRAKITPSHFYYWRGETPDALVLGPTKDVLGRLAEALGVPVNRLRVPTIKKLKLG